MLIKSRYAMGREIRKILFGEVSHVVYDLGQGLQPIHGLASWLPAKVPHGSDRGRKEIGKQFAPITRARTVRSKERYFLWTICRKTCTAPNDQSAVKVCSNVKNMPGSMSSFVTLDFECKCDRRAITLHFAMILQGVPSVSVRTERDCTQARVATAECRKGCYHD